MRACSAFIHVIIRVRLLCQGLLRMCAHLNVQSVDFDIAFGLQGSLQQDPSHDGRGAEEHRQGSDVIVQERATHESSSEEEVSCLAIPSTRFQHRSCWRRSSSNCGATTSLWSICVHDSHAIARLLSRTEALLQRKEGSRLAKLGVMFYLKQW